MAESPDLGPRHTPLRHLGEGGMGEVWLVEDRHSGEHLVAKVAPAGANPEMGRWLAREGEVSGRLDHPGIVRVFDFVDHGDRPFLTMEYLPGGNISSLAGKRPAELLPYLIQVAEALQYAHEQGVVHRDLKAGNVLLDGDGRPRVTDFGIAAEDARVAGATPIAGGGSIATASPQQLAGQPACRADDLYAFGALIHTLVTGSPPFGPNPTEEIIRTQTPGQMTSSWPIPPQLQSLATRLLAKEPADRPSDMESVLSELRALAGTLDDRTLPPSSEPPTPKVTLTPPPRAPVIRPAVRAPRDPGSSRRGSPRSRLPMWGTVALFAALGVLAVVVFFLLPGWVERRPPSVPAESRATPPPPTAVPMIATEVPHIEDPQPPDADAPTNPLEQRRPAPDAVDPPAAAAARRRPGEEEQRIDARFAASMAEGLAALDANDPATARAAFERAGSIRPSSPEVAEGLRRADRLHRRQRIAALGEEAAAAESREDWGLAEKTYAEALAIDQNLAFAQAGHERSARRRKLVEKVEFHLTHPERLVNDEVLAEAGAVLEQALEAEPKGPRFEEMTARLTELFAVASTPVTVSLHSDNLTQVVIYKVGKLGAFARTSVQLRPGTYTVVGSRPGFRDVRVEVTVRPGGPIPPVVIRCKEEV